MKNAPVKLDKISEAFDKFHHWENARTLLKVVVSEKATGPKIFFVNIAWIDGRSLIACFFDPKTGSICEEKPTAKARNRCNFFNAIEVGGRPNTPARLASTK
jgi:hypothetical protein